MAAEYQWSSICQCLPWVKERPLVKDNHLLLILLHIIIVVVIIKVAVTLFINTVKREDVDNKKIIGPVLIFLSAFWMKTTKFHFFFREKEEEGSRTFLHCYCQKQACNLYTR